MFKLKKVVDERQEMELMKIEKLGFWMLYWLLLGSFLVQSMLMDAPFKQFAGEFIVFMIANVYMSIMYIRKGQWDYYTEPTLKSYFLYSLSGATIFSVIVGINNYMRYAPFRENLWTVALPTIVALFTLLFVLMFISMASFGRMVKKRRAKLEQKYGDDQTECSDE